GQVLLYTICNEKYTKGSCDLYISKKQDDGWSTPKNIGPPVNSVAWDSQPSLSADGRRVYFVSNRNGGYGGKDIWYSDAKNGKWSEPVNIGPEINTPFDEQTPSIHFDNQTLYFSSDGHPGLGLHDIYFSRLEDGSWTTPVNLGYPINTNKVESGLDVTLHGIKAYYAAEKEQGFGGLDIYEFDLPEFARPQRVTYVKALIVDSETKKPVNAAFQLSNLTGDEADISGGTINGEFLICLPSGNDYGLQVNSTNYVFESLNFALKDTVQREAYVMTIEIESVDKGINTILQNVFFKTDSYDLLPVSDTELASLYDLLIKHSDIKIEIGGHTDNTGTVAHNRELSHKRAQAVVNHLVNKGINQARLSAKGYGDTMPVADNSTAAGRAQNRRTEFMIVE
ncbi:MAG: OmpA family protein, partial [Bacteroidetes bacterium]|nr:OmpA family protein [Bacteroidota bacterium]